MRKIIHYILFLFLNRYAVLLRLTRHISLGHNNDQSILVVPAADPGNLGDEALVVAIVDYLNRENVPKIGLVSYGPTASWRNLGQVSEVIELSHPFPRNFWRKFRFVHAASRYKQIYVLGADVLDGYYSEPRTLLRLNFVRLATKVGARVAILGFSLNAQPTAASIRALSKLPSNVKLCARDPISQQRLIQLLERPVDLVADLAFLLYPNGDTQLVSNMLCWIHREKSKGRTVIGINPRVFMTPNQKKQSLDNSIQCYVDAIMELCTLKSRLSFVLIAHDLRPQYKEAILAKVIFEALPSEVKSHCLNIPIPYSAAEIKAICGDLDMVLSGKMHLAIACLGQGTPVACIAYQDKFEGLFQHSELDDMIIDPANAIRPGNLAGFMWPLLEKREEIQQHIRLKLPQIQQLARANFESN